MARPLNPRHLFPHGIQSTAAMQKDRAHGPMFQAVQLAPNTGATQMEVTIHPMLTTVWFIHLFLPPATIVVPMLNLMQG